MLTDRQTDGQTDRRTDRRTHQSNSRIGYTQPAQQTMQVSSWVSTFCNQPEVSTTSGSGAWKNASIIRLLLD